MNRFFGALLIVSTVIALTGCSAKQTTNQSAPPANQELKSSASSQPVTQPATQPAAQPGELQVGQASGNYTANGAVIELKHAYAGRGQRFGTEATIILVTDQPIPADAVAAEIESQTLLEEGKLRGIHYVVDKDGLWLRYYPGPRQESTTRTLKEYKVEGDIIRGVDEDKGDLSEGRYQRHLKFVAAIVK